MSNPEDIVAKLQDPTAIQSAQYTMEEDYQSAILSLIVSNRQFLMESHELIRPSYFSNESHRLIANVVFDYYEDQRKLPPRFIIRQAIKDKQKDAVKALRAVGELDLLYQRYIPGLDAKDALQNRILKFAKTQALREAFRKSFELLMKDFESDEHWSQIEEIYRQAITVDRSWDKGLDYFNELEERYLRMREEIDTLEKFTTGIETIDNALGGGMSRGEIYAWMGLPGTGKSLALVTAAVKNVMLGKKVLYISCEMGKDKVAERFDAQFAHEDINVLFDHRDAVIKSIKDSVHDYDDRCRLVIQQFPAGSADVNTLRAYHSQLKALGFIPDMVVVDYVGEMKDHPGLKTYESRFRIVRDLRGFATEENFLCLTAMQPNRSARELQEDPSQFIDDNNLADAFGQTRPLDGLWSINQGNKEKEAGVARGFAIKQRSGKSRFAFFIEFDIRTLMLREISDGAYRDRMSLVADRNADKTKKKYDEIDGPDEHDA